MNSNAVTPFNCTPGPLSTNEHTRMTGQNNRSWGTRQPPGYECGLLQWRPHAGGAFNLRCHLSLSHQPVGSASGHQERPDSLPAGGGSTSRCILGRLWSLHSVDIPLPLHLWLGRRPGQSSGDSPSMLVVLLCSMGLNRSQVSLSYTLHQPRQSVGGK